VDPFQFTFGFGHLSDMAGISNLLHIHDIDRSLYGPGETNNVKKSHIKRKLAAAAGAAAARWREMYNNGCRTFTKAGGNEEGRESGEEK
jgi:hypothetical protein